MAALNMASATLAVFLSSAAFVALEASGHEARQARRASHVPAHVQRGDRVQEHYDRYTKRLDAYYALLVAALRSRAPELLAILQPPHPLQHGYQVLPTIIADPAPLTQPARAQSAQYSWPWTEYLIDRALSDVRRSEYELKRGLSLAPKMRQMSYQQLAVGYWQMLEQQQNIDAHIQYNRLWQGAIAANRLSYDSQNVLHDLVLNRQEVLDVFNARYAAALKNSHGTIHQIVIASLDQIGSGLTDRENLLEREIDEARDLFSIPGYVRVEQQADEWIIHVPFYTDIEDSEFVRSVKKAIEDTWHLRSGKDEFRIALEFSYVSPEYLYGNHEPLQKVAQINIQEHVDRFPRGRAILTTGALTTHARGGAIVLGPHEITKRVLAHEFGHILGFRDAYFRGYKDLGEDGFQVREVVADSNDLMGAPSTGAVLRRHYDRIIASYAINNVQIADALKVEVAPCPGLTTCNGRTLNSTDLKKSRPVEFSGTLASESRRTTAATRRSYDRNDNNREHPQADEQCHG